MSLAGAAVLAFAAWALTESGLGGLTVAAFHWYATISALLVALACVVSGLRFAAGRAASRGTATLSAAAMVVCTGWWAWFWTTLAVGTNGVDRTQTRLDVETAVIAAIALVAAVGAVLIVTPAIENAAPLIAAGLATTMAIGLSSVVDLSGPNAYRKATTFGCRTIVTMATRDLSSIDDIAPEPPQLAGALTTGAALVRADANGWLRVPGIYPLRGALGILAVQQVDVDTPGELDGRVRTALVEAGFAPYRGAHLSSGGGNDSLTLDYAGQRVRGSITYAACRGHSYAVTFQQVRPYAGDICHQHALACAELYAEANRPSTLTGLGLVFSAPTVALDRRGRLSLTMSADDSRFDFFAAVLDDALRGWRVVELRCDGEPCVRHGLRHLAEREAVGVYRKGDMTATVTVTLRPNGDGHIVLRITRPG